jgi:hypothetical protein
LALRKRYEEYGEKADGVVPLLNFYTWCARHGTWGSSPIVPGFVGYYKKPNWALDEEYARTMLIIYTKHKQGRLKMPSRKTRNLLKRRCWDS